MKKKIIIIVLIVLIIIIGITVFFITKEKEIKIPLKKEDEYVTNANDNSEVIKEKEVDGLKISNVMLIVKEEGSTFTADVTNISENTITGNLNISFRTSTNKEVTSILGYFGGSINPGETKQITSSTSRQLKKEIIKSIEYELKR